MGLEKAAGHVARAKDQLKRVQTAADDETPDPESAVTWAFYAYENCIIALAEMHERSWARTHSRKAQLARVFHAEGLISRDIGDELEELNRLRKDVAYDQPAGELEDRDIETLASELEEFISEVETRMYTLRQGKQE